MDLRKEVGKILIAAGVVFLTVALLFIGLNPLDQWVFAGSVFLGIILVASGSVTLVGLFSPGFRSRESLAGCFLIAASAFTAFAVISLVFGANIVAMSYNRGIGQSTGSRSGTAYLTPEVPEHYNVVVDYPNAWLFNPLTATALFLFVASLVLVWRAHH